MVRKQFIFLLIDTPTGKVYYRTTTGTILLAPITAAGVDVTLKSAPSNWLDGTLEFQRNNNYWGIIRSYSSPMDFVKDAAEMIAELTVTGVGTECELTLATYKYNTQPQFGEPTFELYSKGNLELENLVATLLEGITVNMIDGGVSELYKAYENSPVEIPCDGSLPEHYKVNYDGYLKGDRLFFEFVSGIIQIHGISFNSLPTVFINNLNESYGVITSDTSYKYPTGIGSIDDNYNISTSGGTPAKIQGFITIEPTDGAALGAIGIEINKSSYTPSSPDDYLLVTSVISNKTIFEFNKTMVLAPGEKLALVSSFIDVSTGGRPVNISGNFSIDIATKPADSRAWAMSLYDVWRNVGKQICLKASTTGNPVNYSFESAQLQDALNLSINCGDALRASNDPLYRRYYSYNDNQNTEFGPVIKTTLKQTFKAIAVQLMSGLTVGHDSLGFEQLLVERLESFFDSSTVSFSLGEVSSMQWNFSKLFRFTDLKIGYAPQSYDQVSGKYETHTTLSMKAPVKKGQQQILDLVTDWRADVTGIQRLLAPPTTGASTSTTRNTGDSSVFITDIDRSHWILDYFRGLFVSLVSDPDEADNTNIHFENDQVYQKYDHPVTDGGYFTLNKDFAVFVFTEPGYSTTETITLRLDGVINAVNPLPGTTESATVSFWVSGVVVFQVTTNVTGIDTQIDPAGLGSGGGAVLFHALQTNSCIYMTVQTTTACVAQINTASIQVGAYVSMSGANIPVESGTPLKLLSFPTVIPVSDPFDVGTSVVQSGYQYFQYNSNSFYNNFDVQLGVNGYKQGSSVDNFYFQVWINGVPSAIILLASSLPRVQFVVSSGIVNRDFTNGDIVFVTASKGVPGGGGLQVQLITSTLSITNTAVKAYSLYREQYDSLQGIPNLAPDTVSPGAPYNLRLSPRRLLIRAKKFFNSCFMTQVTGPMKFQGLDKNPFLLTVKDGVIIKENADEDLLSEGRLVYPIETTVTTKVPVAFAKLCSSVINLHIHWTFLGHDFYGFAKKLTQKPALNESQRWEFILSPRTDIMALAKINHFKIPDMADNSIYYSFSSPIQFVPYIRVFDDKYHTRNRDESLFREQLATWSEKQDYAMPVQIGDPLQLPFFSNGVDPLDYTVYNCDGTIYLGPNNLDTVASPAVVAPKVNWQKVIDTTSWPKGDYYIIISGALQKSMISEKLCVRPKEEMEGTVFMEYSNSFNTQGIVFDGSPPNRLSMRFYGGFDNRFKQRYVAKFFNDQGWDASVINAITFEDGELFIGRNYGIPDYVAKKVLRALLMDQTKLDGEGFTVSEGSEMEQVVIHGVPMKYQKIGIRPTLNRSGINVTLGEQDDDLSLVVTVNAQTIAPNVTNQSGTTDNLLLELTLNN